MTFSRSLLFLAAILVSTPGSAATKLKTVVVISVDGLGAHLLSQVPTPNIDALARDGARAKRAETIFPTQTVPAHVSMLTGVSPVRHGNYENELGDALEKVKVQTIFDLLKKNGLRSKAVLGKSKLKYVFDNGSVDEFFLVEWPLIGDFPSRSEGFVAQAAERAIENSPPAFLFIHFALVDTMGHMMKWESAHQKWAVQKVDSAIGRIRKSLEKNLEKSSYAVIVTADHGGHEGSHGQITSEGKLEDPERDRVIPWIVYGAGLKEDVPIVKVEDTAASVAALLGLDVPPEWKWEGRSVVK